MRHPFSLVAIGVVLSASLSAQTIQPPFASVFSYVSLGSAPGVPGSYGGVAFRIGDPDALYIGGAANGAAGAVYRIALTRDANAHITGFTGPATLHATAPNIDGGLQFGPGGVLFFTRYPSNELGQIRPGSSIMNKSIVLTPLGVPGSVGALSFIPAGFPNAGNLALGSYNSNRFNIATLSPDGLGTFNVTTVTPSATITGGPEGFFYVPPGSPQFIDFQSMMVCEYGAGTVSVYDLDASGSPLLATRRAFMTGLGGAEGAAIDPLSGDFVFSTFGGGDRVLSVRGFGLPCGRSVTYGVGTPGTNAIVPTIVNVGCFARRQQVSFDITNGVGAAPGLLLAGVAAANVPLFGATILVNPIVSLPHSLGGTAGAPGAGTTSIPMPIPDDTNLLNTDFFFQSVYLDFGSAQGLSATGGVSLRVR